MSPIINIHPGEILEEEFLKPLNISRNRLAIEIRVPVHRIHEIVHQRRNITADTALRLSKFFGTSVDFWLNLQSRHDAVFEQNRIAIELKQIRPYSIAIA